MKLFGTHKTFFFPHNFFHLLFICDNNFRLSSYPNFLDLHVHVTNNLDQWKEYYDSSTPETSELPEPWNTNLSQFQKIVILRCFRSDKLIPAIQQYVSGKKNDEKP